MKSKAFLKVIVPRKYHPGVLPKTIMMSMCKGTVCSGPFKGMKYGNYSVGSTFYPKLLGTYELELHALIQKLVHQEFPFVIDVGAAEGYYACGFAFKSKKSNIIAFEQEDRGRQSIRDIALKNGIVNRLEILGFCNPETLRSILHGKENCLVIMDVEGAELTLLEPINIPELRKQSILVEVHNFVDRSIANTLQNRFEKTHQIKEIWGRDRKIADLPFRINPFLKLYKHYFINLMNEKRPERMNWFYLEPKCKDHPKPGDSIETVAKSS